MSLKPELIELSRMVLDWRLYPRHEVDAVQVRRLRRAIALGEDIPPLTLERSSLRIVDGFHRYHAYSADCPPEHPVASILKDYANDQELFLEAARVNTRHGVALEPMDYAHCVIRAHDLGIEPERMAEALILTVPQIERITRTRLATDPDGEPVIIKRGLEQMAGHQLTRRQVQANDAHIGMRQTYYLGRVIDLLEADLLDLDNPRVPEMLGALRKALDRFERKMQKAA